MRLKNIQNILENTALQPVLPGICSQKCRVLLNRSLVPGLANPAIHSLVAQCEDLLGIKLQEGTWQIEIYARRKKDFSAEAAGFSEHRRRYRTRYQFE
jgi:hypothetical protein